MFFLEIPMVTRIIIVFSIALSYATYTKTLSETNLVLNYELTLGRQFQVNLQDIKPWRFITSILYIGELNLTVLIRLIFMSTVSGDLEKHIFKGMGHYVYFLFLSICCLAGYGLYFREDLLEEQFFTILMYLWSRHNSQRPVIVFFFIPMKAQLLPWFYIFLNLIYGMPIDAYVVGILLGHTYYYLVEVLPRLPHFKGVQMLKTPKFIHQFFSKYEVDRIYLENQNEYLF